MTIGQIAIAAPDLDRAEEFYSHKVGLRLLSRTENVAIFDCEGVRLALERGDSAAGATIYFRVGDLESAVAELRERGVEFERDAHLVAQFPAHELWMALFRDTEGESGGVDV